MKLSCLLLLVVIYLPAFSQKKKSSPPRATIARADSLFLAGNQKEAIIVYEAALKDAGAAKEARPWYRLGVSYAGLKDYGKALPALIRAYHINRSLPGLGIAMARAYSATGNNDQSVAVLDSAIAGGFANYKLMDTDPDLTNLRKDPRYNDLRERAIATAYPCRSLPEAKQFDFWVGTWDVFVTANMAVKAGTNKITRTSEGCVILENWDATGPHTGMSMNYYDPNLRKWQQKWAGSGQDIQEFYDGEYVGNEMRFKFTGTNPDGTTFTGRLTFTNITGSGTVRQHSERTSDGGATWQTIYDFTYVRKADGETP